MAVHGFIDVNGVHRWAIEAGEPHIANDHELEIIRFIAEALGDVIHTFLAADVLLIGSRVCGGASHHHLELTLGVRPVVPVWA